MNGEEIRFFVRKAGRGLFEGIIRPFVLVTEVNVGTPVLR
jgi:hypothetical protein